MKVRKLLLALLYVQLMAHASCWSMESQSNSNRVSSTLEPPRSPDNSAKTSNKNADNTGNKMSVDTKSGDFNANLPDGFNRPSDEVGQKLLKEYGSVFMARNGAIPPKTVVFKNEGEVSAFQSGVQI